MNRRAKLSRTFILAFTFLLSNSQGAYAASPRIGSSCPDAGVIQGSGNTSVFCAMSLSGAKTWQKAIQASQHVKANDYIYVYFTSENGYDCITDGNSDYTEGETVGLIGLGPKSKFEALGATGIYLREAGCSYGAAFKILKNTNVNQATIYRLDKKKIVGFVLLKKDATATVMVQSSAPAEDPILSQPASKYFNTGTALTTLTQVWGVKLSDGNGPRSFKDVAQDIFFSLRRQVGGSLSKSDLEISFQPGNSMYTFFNRLMNNGFAYDAMKARLLYLATTQ